MDNLENTWSKMSKYLAGEMDEKEKEEFLSWKSVDKENSELFNDVKKDMEKVGTYNLKKNIDVDKAWNQLYDRFEKDELLPQKSKVIQLKTLVRIAAVIVLLMGITFSGFYLLDKSSQTISVTASAQGEKVHLIDGSIVTLNKGAKLSYSDKLEGNFRKVKLEGEAFFEVARLENKPFIVSTNDADIKVLGTSFNVCTYCTKTQTEVFVSTGKVQVTKKNNIEEKVVLVPGEIGKVGEKSVRKAVNENKNIISWKTKRLVLEDEPFENIINAISRTYDVELDFSGIDVETQGMNFTVDHASIEVVMELVCTSQNLKWKKEGSRFVIYK